MISVIIPVYNGKETISKTLGSLLNQTYHKNKYEIIIVDDESTDGTPEVVKKYVKKYPKLIRFYRQKHKGPAAARNLGAKKAKGEILLFTDADCIPEREWIEEMVKPFKDKEIVGVQGRYRTRQKCLIAKFAQMEIDDRYNRMKKRKYIDFIGTYSAGYRKDIFFKFGGFDESFPVASGEDPELSFKISKSGYKMVFNDRAVVYHKHPNSLLSYLKQKFWRAYWRVLLYKKHPDKLVRESYTPQTLKFQIAFLFLFLLTSFLSLLSLAFLSLCLAFLMLLFICTLPLSIKNFKRDKSVGFATPVILVLRACAFAFGLVCGAVRL
ncbi:MAG: glycosyltransferase [Candidatus Aenigmarchaeota archaeon]|nr:glycosyltransferase [Candidatus Aenigmarchaeota archaeon]